MFGVKLYEQPEARETDGDDVSGVSLERKSSETTTAHGADAKCVFQNMKLSKEVEWIFSFCDL